MVRRVFIDCSSSTKTEFNTGIQRVVRKILQNLEAIDHEGIELIPVVFDDSGIHRLQEPQPVVPVVAPPVEVSVAPPPPKRSSFAQLGREPLNTVRSAMTRLLPYEEVRRFAYAPSWEFGLSGMLSASVRVLPSSVSSNLLAKPPLPPPPAAAPQAPARQPIDFGPADILVMLDSSWLLNVWPHVRRAKEVGTKVVVAVYDLIPFTHPETVHDDVRVFFKSWYDLSLYYADAYICISETVGKAVTGWIETEWKARGWSRTIKVGHFHLGSDMAYTPVPQPIRPALIAHFEDEAPVFAMVGTLEPRKNHSFVLDAFDILWNSGDESRLLIAGRPGWKVDFLYRRIVAHPEYAKRLLVYHDLNDTELEYVYKKSRALVFASVAEGFGLPIVEAFKEGLTVICSNIEVFQEIASGRATFFDLDSPRHLAAAVRDTVATPRGPQKKAKWLSWLESTQQFVTQVMELASTSHETARLEKSSRPQTQRKATRSVGPQA